METIFPHRVKKQRVLKSVEFIEKNFHKNISSSELERISSMSSSALLRNFKRHTGKTPKQVIIEVRIGKSKDLLAQTDLKVSEIAKCTGFASLSHFSKTFGSNVGMTPIFYRKKSKIKKAAPAA